VVLRASGCEMIAKRPPARNLVGQGTSSIVFGCCADAEAAGIWSRDAGPALDMMAV
jgi:hypothetical protein